MKRLPYIFLTASLTSLSVASLAGCSSGDVVLTPSPATNTTSSADSCKITPGEDICGRTFDLPDGDRTDVVAFLQLASLFAGEARDLFERTFAACDTIRAEIDARAVGLPEDSALKKKQTVCRAVGLSISDLGPSMLTVQIAPPTCTEVPLPACAHPENFQAKPHKSCEPPAATVTVASGASGDLARANVVAASLQRHLPELGLLKQELENLSELTASITDAAGRVGASQDTRSGACLVAATAMIQTAMGELTAAIESSTFVYGSVK